MDTTVLKNETARSVIDALIEAKDEFISRKKGRDWSAMVMTVAQAFPEDKHEIVKMFHVDHVPRKPSGKSRDATPKIKVAARPGNTCKDCPDSVNNAVASGPVMPSKAYAGSLDTTDKVLAAFEGGAEVMAGHARGLGIKLGRSKKPNVIARKIAKYYRDAAGLNEEE